MNRDYLARDRKTEPETDALCPLQVREDKRPGAWDPAFFGVKSDMILKSGHT
jgi:hypothetical protein